MSTYRVRFMDEVEVEADSPKEAVEKALEEERQSQYDSPQGHTRECVDRVEEVIQWSPTTRTIERSEWAS